MRGRKKALTDEQEAEAYRLKEAGMNMSEIGRRFGAAPQTIYNYFNREKNRERDREYRKKKLEKPIEPTLTDTVLSCFFRTKY